MFTKSLFTAALAAFASAQVDLEITSNNKFSVKNNAFLNLGKWEDSEDFMIVSAFGPMSSGHVYVVPGVKEAVQAGDVSSLEGVKLDTPHFEWPNNVTQVPFEVFNERAILVPDGFLVPGKKDGGIYVTRIDANDITKATDTVKITAKKNNYFYHMGHWVDLNGDGRQDLITARSNAKKGHGELLWLEHPEGGLDSGEYWTEHVIGNMADVTFEVDDMPDAGWGVVVFSAQFFDEALSMHHISRYDGSLVQSKVIDDELILSAYGVSLVDLNSDGSRQLLVNNHQTKDKKDGIWAYNFPADPFNDEWTRDPIATNFKNAFSITVPNMAPGFAYAIYPNGKHEGERAHIFVAGDGDHSAHVMYPTGDQSVYEYEDHVFDNAKGTVGCLAFSDLDEDGWQEVWVPNYDKSTIELFKLAPKSTADKPEVFTQ